MNKINSIKDSKKVIIGPSLEYIRNRYMESMYEIVSKYLTINKIKINLSKADREFKFRAEGTNPTQDMVNYQSIGHGYGKQFIIKNKIGQEFVLPKGVANYSHNLNKTFGMTGSIYRLSSINLTKNEKFYLRSFRPITDKQTPRITHYVHCEPFQTENSVFAYGLIDLIYNDINYWLYSIKNDDSEYLVLESKDKVCLNVFKDFEEASINTLALLSGSLIRNEIQYLGSNTKDFKTIEAYSFRRLKPSITSPMEIFSPNLAFTIDRIDTKDITMPNKKFQSLVVKSLENVELIRTIKVITQSNDLPNEIKAATYCVCLETLKNIVQTNIPSSNPIKDKRTSKAIRTKFLDVLDEFDDDLFSNKDAVKKRIDNLNQQTNIDSFESVFISLGIKLTDFDKKCIKLRDLFLHGKVPIEETESDDFHFIAFRLHFLLCAIILKYCGYSGYIKNNVTYHKVVLDMKEIDEPIIRYI